MISDAFIYSEENTTIIDPVKSLYDYFVERLKDVIPEGPTAERKRKIVMQMADLWGGFVGSPVTKQSLKFLWLEQCINGENLFCSGTFKKILAQIAKPAVEGAELKLSTRVTSIITEHAVVKLIVDDGRILEFDEVVVTVPLGFLQKNKEIFSPPLPTRFLQAVDGIGYGSLEKVSSRTRSLSFSAESILPNRRAIRYFTIMIAVGIGS